MDWDEMVKYAKDTKPDMVFVGELALDLRRGGHLVFQRRFAAYWHSLCRRVKTVVGGCGYSGDWERQMRLNPTLDYIMIGEAELTMEDLLKNMNGSPKDEREIPGSCRGARTERSWSARIVTLFRT